MVYIIMPYNNSHGVNFQEISVMHASNMILNHLNWCVLGLLSVQILHSGKDLVMIIFADIMTHLIFSCKIGIHTGTYRNDSPF